MPVSEDVIRQLRAGKAMLRCSRRNAPIEEKLRDLVRAQQLYVQVAGSRRQLKPWQRPWNIMSDVRDTVVIKDSVIESAEKKATVGASRSHWILPRQPWVLRA